MTEKIDKSNLRQIITRSPNQFTDAFDFIPKINTALRGPFKNVVFVGVGGSAMPADIVSAITDLPIPIFASRGYNLHPQASRESLVLCISFSGNTEEVLSVYDEALKLKCSLVAIASGGELIKKAKKDRIPCIEIRAPSKWQPRYGLGYLVSAVLSVLAQARLLPNPTQELKNLKNFLSGLNYEERGRKTAKKLIGKIPIVYASDQFKAVARIIKIKFNESSKVLAFWNYFPELNHNEMVGYTNLQGKFSVFIFEDETDHPRNKKRFQITARLLESKGADVMHFKMEGKTKLEKVFSSLLLGDWITYYLALEYKQDPWQVKMVDDLKAKLNNKK